MDAASSMYLGVAEEVEWDLCTRTISLRDWMPHLNFPRLNACLSSLKRNLFLSGLSLYRVPPSVQNKIQKSSFITDFGDLIEQTSNLSEKLIILGDFNIHVDNNNDSEANQFLDLLDAFGLKQHVSGSTHVRGHTLHLVISRDSDNIVQNCEVGSFASDQNAITFN